MSTIGLYRTRPVYLLILKHLPRFNYLAIPITGRSYTCFLHQVIEPKGKDVGKESIVDNGRVVN